MLAQLSELPNQGPQVTLANLPVSDNPCDVYRQFSAVSLSFLVVDPDPVAGESLLGKLRRHGHTAYCVATGREALVEHRNVDVVLLDLELPDLDGLDVCRRIRSTSGTPIITVTARGSELDRVLGLQAGSDDYVVKPYSFHELLARIEAVLRRIRPQAHIASVLELGSLRIDLASREVCVEDRVVSITRKEFDLLRLLATRLGTVVPRKQIMSRIWHNGRYQSDRTIDTHVSCLRAKLRPAVRIITVRGVGFQLTVGSAHPGGFAKPAHVVVPNVPVQYSRGGEAPCRHCTGPARDSSTPTPANALPRSVL